MICSVTGSATAAVSATGLRVGTGVARVADAAVVSGAASVAWLIVLDVVGPSAADQMVRTGARFVSAAGSASTRSVSAGPPRLAAGAIGCAAAVRFTGLRVSVSVSSTGSGPLQNDWRKLFATHSIDAP